jgi:hypothetical protein
MLRSVALFFLALVMLPVAAAGRPVVVELFTSQGCSSCPPAEALLIRLAQQSDVLALAFHVDYWDGLGWKDTFSSHSATERQRHYAGLLGHGNVFTPQLVVDGRHDVIGSDDGAVRGAIAAARASAGTEVALKARRHGGSVSIEVGRGTRTGSLWLVGYDPRHDTPVARGENVGRTIVQANVVRSLAPVGEWQGQPLTLSQPVGAGQRFAVVLQAPDGAILAAARVGG